jgi:hypothetical protein
MLRHFLGSLIVNLFVLLPLSAQTPNNGKPKPAELEARFHDGTVICKAEILQNIDVITEDRGVRVRVTVLAADIYRIDVGMRLSNEMVAKIVEAVGRLRSANFADRESASKELTEFGFRAYPALQLAVKSRDREVSKRAAEIMSKIRDTAAPELLQLKEHDEVFTRDHKVISGRIEGPTIKVKAKSLGEASLKLADLRSLGNDQDGIAVGAGLPNDLIQWHDTGIDVESETGLVIRASGEIVHPHVFGVQLVTGPQGSIGQFLQGPDLRFNLIAQYRHHPAGTLVGKIGSQSDHFIVGKKYEGTTSAKGRLFLWVVPSLEAEKKPTGSYRIEIAVSAKLGDKAKKMVKYNDDIENTLKPFGDKRRVLVEQASAWKSALGSGKVPAKDRGQYEMAIQKNLESIGELENRMREDFGHVLYPEQWLEPPSPDAGLRLMFR